LRLLNHLTAKFGVGNSGCYNANSTLSSGSPSWHAYGKAIDLGTSDRAKGDRVFQWVLDRREELNLQQMIWRDRIYDVGYGGVRHYSRGDHDTHLHIAIGYQASQSWTPSGPAPAPQPQPEADLTPEEQARLKTVEMLATSIAHDVKKLIEANYEGGDTNQMSRLRHLQRALFPEQGDTSRQSRTATILEDVKALLKKP